MLQILHIDFNLVWAKNNYNLFIHLGKRKIKKINMTFVCLTK